MGLSKNTYRGYIGITTTSGGVFGIDELLLIPELKSFTYTENSGTSTFSVTVPSDTQSGDLMIYLAGCRDGRNQSSFTSGYTDLASGLQNIFVRYKTSDGTEAGTSVTGTCNSGTIGPAALFVFSNGAYKSSSIQGRTGSNYTLNAPTHSSGDIAILFNQDRANNGVTPGLSEILRDADIATDSFYEFHIERNISTLSNQSITNVDSDSVGAYIVITRS